MKKLEEIKHSDKVVKALEAEEMFFVDLSKATSLDAKSLQSCLNKMHKNGYISKNSKGQWCNVSQTS